MIVCIGRLRGARRFGCFGSMRNEVPRQCSMTPLFAARIVEPKALKSELMNDTASPSRSTTERQVVSVSHGATAAGFAGAGAAA